MLVASSNKKLRLPYKLEIPVSAIKIGVKISISKKYLHKLNDGFLITFTN